MDIYVSGKWEERPRVREVMFDLTSAGHHITYDWTICEVADINSAIADLRGVLDADAYVGVFEKDLPYKGALIEMGVALGMGIPIYIIGDALNLSNCIFLYHPNVHVGYNSYVKDLLHV